MWRARSLEALIATAKAQERAGYEGSIDAGASFLLLVLMRFICELLFCGKLAQRVPAGEPMPDLRRRQEGAANRRAVHVLRSGSGR